ncbi:unnamed protein product, partial [Mesorhabditis spiculigera]
MIQRWAYIPRMVSKQPFVYHARTFILGIETSCDDTALAIIRGRKVLSSRRFADRRLQNVMGGITPSLVADQHRSCIPGLLEECLTEVRAGVADLEAVAVTNRPGLVIALKAGVQHALRIARRARCKLIPVHHMRAHAVSSMLVNEKIQFPFVTILVSGGHCLFALCRSASDFELLGTAISGSPGECLDKIGRKLNLTTSFPDLHVGAAIELLASGASAYGHLRYNVKGPSTSGADTDFSSIKSSFLNLLDRGDSISVEDFCASVQFCIARHLAQKFYAALDYLSGTSDLDEVAHVVIGGGVAANKYFSNAMAKVAAHYNLGFYQIPTHLCTDNAEMIAWTGQLLISERAPEIILPAEIPDYLHCSDRELIGADLRSNVPTPKRKIVSRSLHGDAQLMLNDVYL